MAVNWKRLLTWIIGLLVIFAIIFSLVGVFTPGPSPADLMQDTMTLRTTNNTVQRSELITQMDRTVQALESQAINAQWVSLSSCIASNACTQDDYFDFLLMVAVERKDEVPNAGLIINAITVNRYWGSPEKIIEFSKAVSEANDQVERLGLQTVENKWREIVQCDGKCPEYHELFFEFIRLLLSV